MAMYWNLCLLTRTREDAQACVAFFRDKHVVFDKVDVPLEVNLEERPEDWLVYVTAVGMSQGSPKRNSDDRLTTHGALDRITAIFDEWLREAPPFAVGEFGWEAYDFVREGRIDDFHACEGAVVDEATWITLGRPAEAREVRPGRFAWPRSQSTRDP